MDYKEKYEFWLNNVSQEDKEKLVKYDDKLIKEAFHGDLKFGTAGLREEMLLGTNKLNTYTITKTTLGIANYILSSGKESRGVVISYDSRINSREYAIQVAKILASNNIVAKVFPYYTPTPVLSFGVREENAFIGINITASHNPKEYNGYKVYNEFGGQITTNDANEILKFIEGITYYFDTSWKRVKDFEIISDSLYKKYIDNVLTVNYRKVDKKINIIFSALHGTSAYFMKKIWEKSKFKNVFFVEEQTTPDGEFPTLEKPNPEDPSSFSLSEKLFEKVNGDLIIVTDPDADRLGVAIKHKGSFKYLTGNEQAIIISKYLLDFYREKNLLNSNDTIITTIVSTPIIDKIANNYNIKIAKTLTGFKYISEKIKEYEKSISNNFFYGFEESYGCLIKDFARDKDALQASYIFSEIYSYYKNKKMTLVDVLDSIYNEYGYYISNTKSFEFKSLEGQKEMNEILNKLREDNDFFPNAISKIDYLYDNTEFPKDNIIEFNFESFKVIFRPSGTEPLLKVYITTWHKYKIISEELQNTIIYKLNKIMAN